MKKWHSLVALIAVCPVVLVLSTPSAALGAIDIEITPLGDTLVFTTGSTVADVDSLIISRKNENTSRREWEVRSQPSWLDVDIDTGSVAGSELDTVVISVDLDSAAGYSAGQHDSVIVFGRVGNPNDTLHVVVALIVNQPPTASCLPGQAFSTDVGTCERATVSGSALDNGSSDPEGGSLSFRLNPLGPYPLGTNLVWMVVEDTLGGLDSCQINFEIQDNEAPDLTCPTNVVVSTDPDSCGAVITFSALSATDNCGVETISCDSVSGAYFETGVTIVQCIAVDTSGNADTCTFTVTVTDDQAPVLDPCPSDIIQANDTDQCGAVINFTLPGATDNCDSNVDVVADPSSGSTFPVGATTVTIIATDDDGNADTCTFTVTINDTQAPVVSCTGPVSVGNDPGICGAVVSFSPGVTDNCPGVSVVSTPASNSTFPVGITNVEVIATDASGLADTCTFAVTVADTERPSLTCPEDVNVSTDPDACGAVITFSAPSATDNCGVETISCDSASGAFFETGVTIVQCIAVDTSGNADTCTFTVTVTDDQDPVLDPCPSDIAQSNDTDQCGAVVNFTLPGATDNCDSNVDVVATPSSGSTFSVGGTTVTIIATDDDGNADTCSFTVTVNDNQDPAVTCPGNIELPSVDNCGRNVSFLLAATDNCAGVAVASVPVSGSFFTVGVHDVLVTATDVSGNTDTCTFQVEVTNSAPVFVDTTVTINLCDTDTACLPISVSDPDGNIEQIIQIGTDGLICPPVLSGSQIAVGNPVFCWVASDPNVTEYCIILEAIDKCGLATRDTITVVILRGAPPGCITHSDTTIAQCGAATVSRVLSGTGADVCTITSGPGEVVDGSWVYTPSGVDTSFTVGFTCDNACSEGQPCNSSFGVTFTFNCPPAFTADGTNTQQSVILGNTPVPVTATDPDAGDILTISLQSGTLPPGITGIQADGSFTGVTSVASVTTATIRVCDDHGSCATTVLVVTVIDTTGAGNTCPVIVQPSPSLEQWIWDGGSFDALVLGPYESDVDVGDILTWDLEAAVSCLTIAPAPGTSDEFDVTVTCATQAFARTPAFTLNDGACTATGSLGYTLGQFLVALPDGNDFGQVLLGRRDSLRLTVTNPRNVAVNAVFDVPAGLEVKHTNGTPIDGNSEPLTPNANDFWICWTPSTPSSQPGTIVISAGSIAGSRAMALEGSTVEFTFNPNPNSANFGPVNSVDSRAAETLAVSVTVTVRVGGSTSATTIGTIQDVWVADNPGVFTIMDNPAAGTIGNASIFAFAVVATTPPENALSDNVMMSYTVDLPGLHLAAAVETDTVSLVGITATGTAPACVEAEPLDFGKIVIGEESRQSLAVTNTASVSVFIDGVVFNNFPSIYSHDENGITFPYHLEAASTGSIPILFAPASGQRYLDALNLQQTGVGGCASIAVDGIGKKRDWQVSAVTCGEVPLCHPAACPGILILANVGGDKMIIEDITIDDPAWFDSFSPSLNSQANREVETQESIELTVTFDPADVGQPVLDPEFRMTIHYHTQTDPSIGLEEVFVFASGSGCAGVLGDIAALDYPDVELGDSAMLSLTLENTGACDLVLQDVTAPSPFSVVHDGSDTLASGQTLTLSVYFKPATETDYNESLTIKHSGYVAPFFGACPISNTTIVTMSGSGADTQPPVVILDELIVSGNQITVPITDAGTGVDDAWARLRPGNAPEDFAGDSMGMSEIGNSVWRLSSVPFVPDTLSYELKIFAVDEAGAANGDSTDWQAILGGFGDQQVSISRASWFGQANPDSFWHLISIPGDLAVFNFEAIFDPANTGLPGITGDNDNDLWRVVRYAGGNIFPNVLGASIESGAGYWFRSINLEFSLPLPAGSTYTTVAPFSISLHRGWNLIGNPYFFPVWIDRAMLSSIDCNSLYGAEPAESGNSDPTGPPNAGWVVDLLADADSTRLVPWKGYAIFCERTGTTVLELEPHFRPDVASGSPSAASAWTMPVSIWSDGREWGRVTLGVSSAARDHSDAYDLRPFTMFRRAAALSVGNPETPERKLIRDMRRSGGLQTWDIAIARHGGGSVTLQWDVDALPAAGASLVLNDRLTNRVIDMTARSHYDVPNPDWMPQGRLRVLLGSVPMVESRLEEEAAQVPADFVLEQNYPNPFNAGTIIPYTIPNPGHAYLAVFDILGRRVATLVDEVQLAGQYQVNWDGTDVSGRPVSTGLYVARLQVGSQTQVRKMVVLK